MTTGSAARGTATSAAAVGARVDAIRRTPDAARTLAGMLDEQSPLFAGRGTTDVERLRGYILASFETAGLPPEAVPFVLEELETGRNPYTVAAAARALRGALEIPAEAPSLLVASLARLRGSDDIVSFERFEPAPARGAAVTALTELADALSFLGPRAKAALGDLEALVVGEGESFSPAVRVKLQAAVEAISRAGSSAPDCCCGEVDAEAKAATRVADPDTEITQGLGNLALEDQDGLRLSFSEAFSGRPTALAFFYTRCTNPEKCSLTVTRLARLGQSLVQAGLDANAAGISYDPGFDRPARLKTFGADRGMIFSPRCRLLRTVGPFEPLRDSFDLGVGFGPVTVNRHRLDLVVLDASLDVVERLERRLWHEETVLDALRAAAPALI
jgi:cytochrome oxidase Cu insertion factor (SCO1/SenC/PrrC family)